MTQPSTGYAVSGGTPGADSNTYTLFSTVTAMGAKVLPTTGIKRFTLTMKNSHSGTLKAYCSTNGGTTWDEYSSQAVAAAGSGVVNGPYDFLVDPFYDWKLDFVNGGSAQTTWRLALVGHYDRALGG